MNQDLADLAANDVRALAWRRILAAIDDTHPRAHPKTADLATATERHAARVTAQRAVRYDQLNAGVSDAELDAEELDIYRRYAVDGYEHMRDVGRRYLAGLQDAGPDGPPPGAEDYRVGTVEDCPDDGFEWPGEEPQP